MTKKDFIKYCNDNWDVEWYEMAKALDVMDKCRCPLYMANESIVSRIRDLAECFIDENDLNEDWFDNKFDDEEEVFWKLDEKWFDPKNYEQ